MVVALPGVRQGDDHRRVGPGIQLQGAPLVPGLQGNRDRVNGDVPRREGQRVPVIGRRARLGIDPGGGVAGVGDPVPRLARICGADTVPA
jgi:hypothetical protein